jgi:addiction module HigA family antidote
MSKSSTITTNKRGATGRKTPRTDNAFLPLITPGEILLKEFLEPMGLSQNALARATHVPPRRINEIVLGQRAVTADTDLRLAKYFGVSEGFFLGLQTDHDLRAKKRELAKELHSIAARHAAE